MPRETMTPRERWLAVLNHKIPDRVPTDYWTTSEANKKLREYLGCTSDELHDRLHIDRVAVLEPPYIGPRPAGEEDALGCRWRVVDYGDGKYTEIAYSPLARYKSVEEIKKNYDRWPSADWYDYSALPKMIVGKERHPISAGGSEPFLQYKNLRGDAQAFVDLIENPEIVRYCLGKLYGAAYERTRRIYEAVPGRVDMSYIAEDLGSQHGLMFSPAQIREFFLPHMKRMIGLAHAAGAKVFHHDDGGIRAIIPDLIETGIDLLNPIQWRCAGMERAGLKRDFGDRIVFHGAMDNQHTLPFGSVEDVKREVIENIRILGAGGGYILAPCHNIQVVSPPENIVAMYETCYEYGWY